ncbi:hypothetical protein [Microbacterium gallinarum]|uniref:Uncharacterized protein n=1 Tax=Microbacterium gallinarum TaxID=2762209 RepID=A0ABR8X279_9MICO|nr:hypothetical protein [Microbacterium gallinarum]MBD8023449.1 hypothetical protein [Microbacterium gallinarum]
MRDGRHWSNTKPRRLIFTAVIGAFGILLVACQVLDGGLLSVERSGSITFLRAEGKSDSPDIYYEGTVTIGQGDCLYVEFPDETQKLVILDDDTVVTDEGLVTPDGFEVAFGDEVKLARTNAAYYDMDVEGIEACDDSGRAGVAFIGDPG